MKLYHQVYNRIIEARECSLPDGMRAILDTPDEHYAILQQICKWIPGYIAYVNERLKQLNDFEVKQATGREEV